MTRPNSDRLGLGDKIIQLSCQDSLAPAFREDLVCHDARWAGGALSQGMFPVWAMLAAGTGGFPLATSFVFFRHTCCLAVEAVTKAGRLPCDPDITGEALVQFDAIMLELLKLASSRPVVVMSTSNKTSSERAILPGGSLLQEAWQVGIQSGEQDSLLFRELGQLRTPQKEGENVLEVSIEGEWLSEPPEFLRLR